MQMAETYLPTRWCGVGYLGAVAYRLKDVFFACGRLFGGQIDAGNGVERRTDAALVATPPQLNVTFSGL